MLLAWIHRDWTEHSWRIHIFFIMAVGGVGVDKVMVNVAKR